MKFLNLFKKIFENSLNNIFKKKLKDVKNKYLDPLIQDESLSELLFDKNFEAKKILIINNNLAAAINTINSKLAIIENFNMPNMNYQEIAVSLISKIEKTGSTLKIYYIKAGDKNVLCICPFTKEHCNFFYEIYKCANLKKLRENLQDKNLTLSTSSNFEIDYLWAYNPKNSTFAYYKTTSRQAFSKFNLKKEEFFIDTKYNHLELPIAGKIQQLYLYETNFIEELFSSLHQTIKKTTIDTGKDGIFYDMDLNIIYLSDNQSSLQSIKLSEIREYYSKDNKIYFIPHDPNKREIAYRCNENFIKEFEDFVISLNLRKISTNFDYKTDKIINTTSNTKFIIDTIRNRFVYSANLNRLSQFSYISIAFEDIKDSLCEKTQNRSFVRIFTIDNDVIDITCKKFEVAQYINAQIQLLTQRN